VLSHQDGSATIVNNSERPYSGTPNPSGVVVHSISRQLLCGVVTFMDEASYEGLVGALCQGALGDVAWIAALRGGDANHRRPGTGAVAQKRPLTMSGL
jgi:hypothetical protein